jgi:hypothetical protein
MAFGFITNESQVNSSTAGNQRGPATTALPNGGYVTVWASDTGDGSGKAIMGQLFAADGTKVGAEFLINTTTAGDQDLPDVVAYNDSTSPGGVPSSFIVVWQSAEESGSVIRGRRFLEDGTPARFNPNSQTNLTDSDVVVSGTFGGSKPSAGLYGTGRLAIVWEAPSGDGDGTAIVMAQYRSGLSAPVVVNSTTAGNQVDPRIGDSSVIGASIVWESQEPGGDVIRGRILSQAGLMGSDVVLSEAVGEDESLPNVAEAGTLVIWNSGTNIVARDLGYNVAAQSAAVGSSFILNTTPGGVISRSDIVALDNDAYMAVYFTQAGDDGSSYSIRAEYFSRSAGPQSFEVLVPQSFAGAQEAPTIVRLTNGNIVITWASEADALGNFEIKQRLLVLSTTIEGDSGDNAFAGTPNADLFLLHQGGNDSAMGYQSNDVFIFRAALTSQDKVDGGDGRDQIAIQGNYTGGNALTLGTGVVNVESFVLVPGNDLRRGDPGTNSYSYHVTTVNENVALGQVMTFDGAKLRVGENFTFRGAAETDGGFKVVGGLGIDDFVGGSQSDVFLFNDGAFGASDVVDGGAGTARDQLALRGNYNTIAFGAGQLISIESLAILSGHDIPQNVAYNYTVIMNDNNLLGGSMTIDAAQLRADETFNFFGYAESDGFFRISGGAGSDQILGGMLGDRIRGNGGSDNIYGREGADELTGGADNDRFAYDFTADSTAAATDRITDFTAGDLIVLETIDARPGGANDAFAFIGSAAFTLGTAGQLRAYEVSGEPGHWFVEADVNGDAIADMVIEVYTTDLQPLDAADFVL